MEKNCQVETRLNLPVFLDSCSLSFWLCIGGTTLTVLQGIRLDTISLFLLQRKLLLSGRIDAIYLITVKIRRGKGKIRLVDLFWFWRRLWYMNNGCRRGLMSVIIRIISASHLIRTSDRARSSK